ncbi:MULTISPECIES: hypothetical protein [unclassified Yoonia]|uniref:hypothetical protein n=1 Tax=unclassified Yoonia TaxID=2629118 RepID=UPI002AFED15A|nr:MULTISPECIES: hypothetical protein [unclassified Yoonia]
MQPDRRFETALRASLPDGFALDGAIWDLIGWLAAQNQTFRYRRTDALFMPTMPVASMDDLWSHLAFVIEPDLVRHWFGTEGLERTILPLVRCGGDGSYLAVWKNVGRDTYVFLGSEGETFTITDNVTDFIMLITMGYFSIEDRHTLTLTPQASFAETHAEAWPDPIEVKRHVATTLGVSYPATGDTLVLRQSPDPFCAVVGTGQS